MHETTIHGIEYSNQALSVEKSYHPLYCHFFDEGQETDYERNGKKGKKVGETDEIAFGQRQYCAVVIYDIVVFDGDNSITQVVNSIALQPEK